MANHEPAPILPTFFMTAIIPRISTTWSWGVGTCTVRTRYEEQEGSGGLHPPCRPRGRPSQRDATKTIQPSFVAVFFVLEQAGNGINIDGEQPQGSSSISRTSSPPPADMGAHPLDGLCRLRLSRTQATLSFRLPPLASSSQTAEGASGKEMGDRAALSGRGLDWIVNGTREVVSKRQRARTFLRASGPARRRFPGRHQLRRSGETGRGSDKASSQLQKTTLQRIVSAFPSPMRGTFQP